MAPVDFANDVEMESNGHNSSQQHHQIANNSSSNNNNNGFKNGDSNPNVYSFDGDEVMGKFSWGWSHDMVYDYK